MTIKKKVWRCPECKCTKPPKAYSCPDCRQQFDTNYNVIEKRSPSHHMGADDEAPEYMKQNGEGS